MHVRYLGSAFLFDVVEMKSKLCNLAKIKQTANKKAKKIAKKKKELEAKTADEMATRYRNPSEWVVLD